MKKVFFSLILIIVLCFSGCGTRRVAEDRIAGMEEDSNAAPQIRAEEAVQGPAEETEEESPPEEPIAPPEETKEPIIAEELPAEDESGGAEASPEENAEETSETRTVKYIRAKVTLNVRAGAGTQYAVVGQLDPGDCVACYGREGDWYKTAYKGMDAYVSTQKNYAESVEIVAEEDAIERVIAAGCRLLGMPYVYGAARVHDGSGRENAAFDGTKFDCSSLMQYMFYVSEGTLLSVTSRLQSTQGTAVGKGELRRGDLLFFTNVSRRNKTGVERIGHVGMYLGNNMILHTASDHAVIENITTARWKNFVCARRIL